LYFSGGESKSFNKLIWYNGVLGIRIEGTLLYFTHMSKECNMAKVRFYWLSPIALSITRGDMND